MDALLLCDSLVEMIMAKKNKIEKTDGTKKKILDYNTPGIVGSLESVSQYVKTQGISRSKAQKELEKDLAYTLHKQRCRRGVFQPVVVFDIDQQWVADLVEVQSISK